MQLHPRPVLRAEGLAVFAGATAAYVALGAPLWLFLLLALAPDLSMLGYLAGPRVGSATYNAAHTYVGPLVLAAAGVSTGLPLATAVALVWAAHVGMDRGVGYGLKYATGFGDTHLDQLSRQEPPPAAGTDPAAEPVDHAV